MVRLAVFSDLHTEFHADQGRSALAGLTKDVDIAIVPGDIASFYDFERTLTDICLEYPNVVYVTGNHEYYHSMAFNQVSDILLNLEQKMDNLTWLNNSRVKVEGLYFIGATLWFQRSVAAQINKRYLNDFKYVPNCDPFVFEEYDYTKAYFENVMQEGDIVVTHHAPSYNSVVKRFVGQATNCFFANRLDTLIFNKKPKLWLHGHMHDNSDYVLGNTRVICNPFGYPGENPMFKDDLVVEV